MQSYSYYVACAFFTFCGMVLLVVGMFVFLHLSKKHRLKKSEENVVGESTEEGFVFTGDGVGEGGGHL